MLNFSNIKVCQHNSSNSTSAVEDEQHFLIECSKFNEYRNIFFKTVNSSCTIFFINKDNCVHFVDFLTHFLISQVIPGHIAQSVTCLATDACLTADPGVASSILARSRTFVEIDHEIISTVILLLSAESFKKGCCQLQAKVCAQITG